MTKASKQKIVFIGSGNVATSLAVALKGKREIIQVYSKTLEHAKKLGQQAGCAYTNDLKKISPSADLYIVAVKDDSIESVCKKLILKNKIVVHTSGSTDIKVLKNASNRTGVIWPMHSFAGKAKLEPDTPFFIEASDKKTEKELAVLVKELKGKAYYTNSVKRAMIHMTAVFVNNFPNHLFTIAESICKEAGVPFNLFLPLAKETVENITKQSPALAQTGPASRNDKRILDKHLALLSDGTPLGKLHPVYKEIYKVLTKSIIETQRARKKL
jgi:predicted short-subunit dehydrogenase-like oxidoreductase (DUF2520 family)